MEIQKRLAVRVKALRLAKGWSQEELAHQAGMHRTFVSQIEDDAFGRTRRARFHDVDYLCAHRLRRPHHHLAITAPRSAQRA